MVDRAVISSHESLSGILVRSEKTVVGPHVCKPTEGFSVLLLSNGMQYFWTVWSDLHLPSAHKMFSHCYWDILLVLYHGGYMGVTLGEGFSGWMCQEELLLWPGIGKDTEASPTSNGLGVRCFAEGHFVLIYFRECVIPLCPSKTPKWAFLARPPDHQ